MARTSRKKPDLKVVDTLPSTIGHNSGASAEQISDDQQRALFIQSLEKIKRAKEKAATATADLRNLYKVAKAEGFSKADIDYAISLEKDDDDKMIERRRREQKIAAWMNHPIGTQADLFESKVDDRPLKDRAFEEGKIAGMKGEVAKPPYDTGTDGYSGYMEGYHAGQAAIFNIQKKEDPPAPLLRPEGNEPAAADEFDNASEGVGTGAPWPDDAAVAARESAEQL